MASYMQFERKTVNLRRLMANQGQPLSCNICHRVSNDPEAELGWTRTWDQYFCKDPCLLDKRCRSCGRIEVGETEYNEIVDGRKICSDCLSTSTMDMEECRRILTSPLNFFGQIGLTLEDTPHVFLVDKDEMQRIRVEERCLSTCFGNFQDEDTDPTLGLFTTIKLVNCVTTCSRVGNEFQVSKMAMEVPGTTKCGVQCNGKAILILYGMARIKTQAAMAHELMHLWLSKQGWASRLSDKVEEGLCHLISHMWLEQYVAENEFTQQLKEYLMEANEHNGDRDRREKFREAKQAVDKYGLMATLEHLRKRNNFHPSTRLGIVSRFLGT